MRVNIITLKTNIFTMDIEFGIGDLVREFRDRLILVD